MPDFNIGGRPFGCGDEVDLAIVIQVARGDGAYSRCGAVANGDLSPGAGEGCPIIPVEDQIAAVVPRDKICIAIVVQVCGNYAVGTVGGTTEAARDDHGGHGHHRVIPGRFRPSLGLSISGRDQNCSSSVEPAMASVEDAPPDTTVEILSK